MSKESLNIAEFLFRKGLLYSEETVEEVAQKIETNSYDSINTNLLRNASTDFDISDSDSEIGMVAYDYIFEEIEGTFTIRTELGSNATGWDIENIFFKTMESEKEKLFKSMLEEISKYNKRFGTNYKIIG